MQDGQRVAFLGDSITAYAAGTPAGYIRLVVGGLAIQGIHIVPVQAGVGGNTSKDMLARLDTDVIAHSPDWVTVSCGVNDVWHGADGVSLDAFRQNVTAIADRCQRAGIKVMLLTATPIGEDPADPNNVKLAAYNGFLREFARSRRLPMADVGDAVRVELKRRVGQPHATGNQLTVDGVHMNPLGNRVMAGAILRAFGMDERQLRAVRAAWLDVPRACEAPARAMLTFRQYEQVDAVAAREHRSIAAVLGDVLDRGIAQLLREQAPTPR